MDEPPGNPTGAHRAARAARRRLDDARDVIAELAGAEPGQVVFTSGGTEADALAVLGVLDAVGGRSLCSAVEHAAVLEPVRRRHGTTIGVDGAGRIDLDALAAALDDDVSLVSVMAANNETGVVQPVAEVVDVVRSRAPRAVVHTDAVQAAAWRALPEVTAGCDLVSLSAHKLGGPPGVGALVVGDAVTLAARSLGGGQERERRAGTQDVPGAVGFAAAARAVLDAAPTEARRVAALRDDLVDCLEAEVPGLVRTVPEGVGVLPSIAHVCVPGVDSESLVFLLDRADVAVSAASSCSSGAAQASHVLAAMGVDPELARGALRLSLGWSTTTDEIDEAVEAVATVVERLRAST
jgi:cysteine desulfurase